MCLCQFILCTCMSYLPCLFMHPATSYCLPGYKVALFSLSKFQYVSDSLHSCTNRQNIQSHCFNSLVPRPSRNYCFKTPQNETSIRCPFCFSSGKLKTVLIVAHSRYNIPSEFPGGWNVLMARIDYMTHYHDSVLG